MGNVISIDDVRGRMMVLRGQRVMLSGDLAELYGVEHRALIQAVKRNRARFPDDFMFTMTPTEWARLRSQTVTLEPNLRSQIVISSWGGTRYPPLAFTEHGVAMLSSVLKSPRAIGVNIQIVRTFVHFRRWLISNRQLARRMDELEKKYDGKLNVIIASIEELMEPAPSPPRRPIGFKPPRRK
jgi:hypothetical protein